MPFRDEFRDLYEIAIKPACQDAQAYCESVEEQAFVGDILDRIHNQIAKADIIVALMTGRNPNVFYETGYAHALNKRVVLLTEEAEDIPFDLKHFPHIIYGKRLSLLREQLSARVRWCIENPANPLADVDFQPEFLFNGSKLERDRKHKLALPLRYWDRRAYKGRMWRDDAFRAIIESSFYAAPVSIGIHNASTRVVNCSNFRVSLLLSGRLVPLPLDSVHSAVRLPDGRFACNLKLVDTIEMFPDSWGALDLVFVAAKTKLREEGTVEAELRCTTPVGVVTYPVVITLKYAT